MSIRALIRDSPSRSIALVTATHALVFRQTQASNDPIGNGSLTSASRTSLDASVASPKCIVEFSTVASADLQDYRNLCPSPVHGTLGLITINNDVFLCLVTGAARVAVVRPGETVEKIYAVEFYCLSSSDYDTAIYGDLDPYSIDAQEGYQSRRETPVEHPCLELQKLLGNGSFYFSTDFDLTNRLQDRTADGSTFDLDALDQSFLWNSYMIGPLVKFRSRLVSHEREALDKSGILTSAIRGFVLTITIPPSSAPARTSKTGLPSSLTLISRLSCLRAGTRFNSRGIDDDGNVANFVESETIYWTPMSDGQYPGETVLERPAGLCFSYAQIRGSVPVFWEQAAGLIPGQQKITPTRSAEGTQPAFDKHFQELERNYGGVHVVNLLSETKPGEAELTGLFRYGIRHCSLNLPGEKSSRDHQLLRETEFDFHAETKGPNGYEAASAIRGLIESSAEGFAYYLSEDIEDLSEGNGGPRRRTVVILQQEGVFRTNCLDCLDRTNLIQTIISQMGIGAFLGHRGERAAQDFWMRHSSLWADNGDALSRIYAGTGALKSSFTRHGKMSLAGAIADARKSATRLYINNFADKGRQNTIDVLLGRLVGQTSVHLFDPINDYVTAELAKRSAEFQSSAPISIWAGTLNLNGRTNGIEEDLSSWLCPDVGKHQQQPEIVAVGFQEIVELSPQQIMNSDPTRKQEWETAVRKTLNRSAKAANSERYVLLRSGQLVGAALCIFVKSSVLRHIKNVEGSVKKTGMSGMAGNKGAVAIRMDYANTQICFVTAHLAAGFANYEERNRDYSTIHNGLRFQRNRGIDDHDTVIWMGDFNYRIGLGSEKVKQLIKMGDLETLYENDQLNLQMVAGLAFQYYSESRITFNPTYKYDIGEDTYDTSEKARIPAWTDRILRKGPNLRQIDYNVAQQLRFSDHRPIYATFQCMVSVIDGALRETLSHEIYESRRAEVSSSTLNNKVVDSDDEDLIGYDSIEPGLPPASSDKRKWWLDNGKPARSEVKPPQEGATPNPRRPSNPFSPSDESDWVTVQRMPVNRTASQSVPSFPPPPPKPRPTNGARKLPPAYNSPIASLGNTLSQTSLQQESTSFAETLHNKTSAVDDRRASSSSATSKKSAPPVGRKPVLLAASPASSISSKSSQSRPPQPLQKLPQSSNGSESSLPPRRSAATSPAARGSSDTGTVEYKKESSYPPLPPQPRRSGATNGTSPGAHNSQIIGQNMRPGLPPRPIRDLLGDDDDELSGWEALKPT